MQTQEGPSEDDREHEENTNATEDDDPTPRLGHGFKKLDGTRDKDSTPKVGHGFRAVNTKQGGIVETTEPAVHSGQDSEKARSDSGERITEANVESISTTNVEVHQSGEEGREQTTRIGTDHEGYWRSGPSQRSSTEDLVATLEERKVEK